MRIKFVKSGKTVQVNDSYGTRLIEQGMAIPESISTGRKDITETGEKSETAKSRKGK